MQSSIKTLLAFIFVILLLQLSCKNNSIVPEIGKWELLGLEGKLVNDLKLVDNYLYACAGRDGLFRLNLNGSSKDWEYLGLADTRVERQLDAGVTGVILVNNTLIVSYRASEFIQKHGIYRSPDNGANWFPSDSGMFTSPIQSVTSFVSSIEQSPYSPDLIFINLSNAIYKSIDQGIFWTLVNGNPEAVSHNYVFKFIKKDEIWAGGETGRFAPYLLKSIDGGESWSDYIWFPENFGPFYVDNAVYDIAIDPADENTLYFGMLGVIGKTTDKGETFQRILGWDDGIYRYWRLGMNPANPKEIFATGFYLYRTLDGGETWQKIEPPFYEIYALAVNWKQRIVYVSVSSPENGIYRMQF